MMVNYFHKGSLIGVTGRMQSRVWEDKEGRKHKAVEVLFRASRSAKAREAGRRRKRRLRPRANSCRWRIRKNYRFSGGIAWQDVTSRLSLIG